MISQHEGQAAGEAEFRGDLDEVVVRVLVDGDGKLGDQLRRC